MATSVIDSWLPGTADPSPPEAEPLARPLAADLSTTEAAWQPFQFRLRTLLGLVALAGGLCAVFVNIGPLWSILILWIGVLIAAHVAGNACGSTRTGASPMRLRPPLETARVRLNLRVTRLRERHGPGPLMLVGVGLGALAGGLVGTVVLWAVYWESFGPGPVVFGGASSAVVGGFLGFLSASFVEVAGRAWQEASGEIPWRR